MKRLLTLIVFTALVPAAHAQLWVSPSSVNFFDQDVGSFGVSQTISVTNGSDKAVQVQVYSNCYSDFTLTNYCSFSLDPNLSCYMDIRFSPRQEGSQSCNIQISDSAGSYGFVNVSGRGVRRN